MARTLAINAILNQQRSSSVATSLTRNINRCSNYNHPPFWCDALQYLIFSRILKNGSVLASYTPSSNFTLQPNLAPNHPRRAFITHVTHVQRKTTWILFASVCSLVTNPNVVFHSLLESPVQTPKLTWIEQEWFYTTRSQIQRSSMLITQWLKMPCFKATIPYSLYYWIINCMHIDQSAGRHSTAVWLCYCTIFLLPARVPPNLLFQPNSQEPNASPRPSPHLCESLEVGSKVL